jgi:hypothetical protein
MRLQFEDESGNPVSRFETVCDTFYRPEHPACEVLGSAPEKSQGAQRLDGMLVLGNAFRYIEKLYAEGAIGFTTRRYAGNLLCEKFKDLSEEITMWDFSRGNPENKGCE